MEYLFNFLEPMRTYLESNQDSVPYFVLFTIGVAFTTYKQFHGRSKIMLVLLVGLTSVFVKCYEFRSSENLLTELISLKTEVGSDGVLKNVQKDVLKGQKDIVNVLKPMLENMGLSNSEIIELLGEISKLFNQLSQGTNSKIGESQLIEFKTKIEGITRDTEDKIFKLKQSFSELITISEEQKTEVERIINLLKTIEQKATSLSEAPTGINGRQNTTLKNPDTNDKIADGPAQKHITNNIAGNAPSNSIAKQVKTTEYIHLSDICCFPPGKSKLKEKPPLNNASFASVIDQITSDQNSFAQLILVGSVDKSPLSKKSQIAYGSNLGLAQARAEWVKNQIGDQIHDNVKSTDMITLVSGPKHSVDVPEKNDVDNLSEKHKLDRCVKVFVKWKQNLN